MKETGAYFRYKNPANDKWESWLFEDLPESKQKEYLENRSQEWLKSMILILADNIRDNKLNGKAVENEKS